MKQPKPIVNIVVDRLSVMAVVFAITGGLLIYRGFHGDLLIGGAITCAGAIGAILSKTSPTTTQDVKVVNDPDKPEERVPVDDKKA
jgi:hypothetical protein